MTDIDQALRALADRPAHPALAGSEAVVLRRIAARPDASLNRHAVLAVAAAAVLGTAAGYASDRSADAPRLALDSGAELAPSTLLVGS